MNRNFLQLQIISNCVIEWLLYPQIVHWNSKYSSATSLRDSVCIRFVLLCFLVLVVFVQFLSYAFTIFSDAFEIYIPKYSIWLSLCSLTILLHISISILNTDLSLEKWHSLFLNAYPQQNFNGFVKFKLFKTIFMVSHQKPYPILYKL